MAIAARDQPPDAVVRQSRRKPPQLGAVDDLFMRPAERVHFGAALLDPVHVGFARHQESRF